MSGSCVTAVRDSLLADALSRISDGDDDFWSFRGGSPRLHVHGMFQYPAMMVPDVQSRLIDAILSTEPDIRTVADPFVGSGTTLVESMFRRLDFVGIDVNPLAILVSTVKSGPFYCNTLQDRVAALRERLADDGSMDADMAFPGLDKWFSDDIAMELMRIRRAIKEEPRVWARRFFWVAMATAVRNTCNSRTSTFKLHIRPQHELEQGRPSALPAFYDALTGNLRMLEDQASLLANRECLSAGRYGGSVELRLADIRSLPSDGPLQGCCDLLITSPPYGDNKSTVPYGQYSYLPLQWIDLKDISPDADSSLLTTTGEIDSVSLGGSLVAAEERADELAGRSPSFAATCSLLRRHPPDRLRRVAAFCSDLDASLTPISRVVRDGGLMLWTVGNRRVGGHLIPLDSILCDLLAIRGVSLVTQLQREIWGKRMAYRNSIAPTMREESMLVFRKGA